MLENESLIGKPLKRTAWRKIRKLDEYNSYYYEDIYQGEGKSQGEKARKSNTKTIKDFPSPPKHPEYGNVSGDAKYKGDKGTAGHQEDNSEKGHAQKQTQKNFPQAGSGAVKGKVSESDEKKKSKPDLGTVYANDYYAELNGVDQPGVESPEGLPKDTPNNIDTVDSVCEADKSLKKREKNPATDGSDVFGSPDESQSEDKTYDQTLEKIMDDCKEGCYNRSAGNPCPDC